MKDKSTLNRIKAFSELNLWLNSSYCTYSSTKNMKYRAGIERSMVKHLSRSRHWWNVLSPLQLNNFKVSLMKKKKKQFSADEKNRF